MQKPDPSRPASLDDGTPTRTRRAFQTVALALFLGSVLTAPAVADEEGTGDPGFDKFVEWNAANRDYEDAAEQASAAKEALDAATRARDEALGKVEEARRNLDSKLDAERSLPPGSSRTERLQARSDVDAARNEATSAQRELDDANAALDEAEQAHSEAQAEAEALRAKAERLKQERDELNAQQDAELASEGSDAEGGDSAIGSAAPAPDPEIADTGLQGGGTAGAEGGVDPRLRELIQRSSNALAEARNALEAMAAALSACDAEALAAARQRVQSALGVLAQTADIAYLDLSAAIASSGAGDANLLDLAAAAHAAMNQIASTWKSIEQLWAQRCGAGAVCAAPSSGRSDGADGSGGGESAGGGAGAGGAGGSGAGGGGTVVPVAAGGGAGGGGGGGGKAAVAVVPRRKGVRRAPDLRARTPRRLPTTAAGSPTSSNRSLSAKPRSRIPVRATRRAQPRRASSGRACTPRARTWNGNSARRAPRPVPARRRSPLMKPSRAPACRPSSRRRPRARNSTGTC
jgi:hypothetical protein